MQSIKTTHNATAIFGDSPIQLKKSKTHFKNN